MTEKRFTNTDNGFIVDYESEQKVLNLYDVVDVLNELHSRNKRLEQKIQRERKSYTKQHLKWSKEAENKIKELTEENEHLKIRFKEERDTAMRLGSECDNLTIKNQKLELEIIRLEMIIKTSKKGDLE